MARRLRKDQKVELLSGLSLFEECTRAELGQIASIMVETVKPAGSLLTREGQDGGIMFLLVEGEADVVSGAGQSGGGKLLNHLGPGDVVGELSLIDGQTRSATVRATTDVRVLELTSEDFQKLINSSTKFVLALLRSLSIRVRAMDALAG